MQETQEELTLDNFTERTGRRFRVSREQNARIKAGSLTRQGAFEEFMANGGTNSSESNPIPISVLQDPEMSLDNFTKVVRERIGENRRFRVSSEQNTRIKSGELTREEAFSEWVRAQVEADQTQTQFNFSEEESN